MNTHPDDFPRADWRLLISDIDDTLTGDADALVRLTDAINGRHPHLRIVVNSSRPYGSVRATLDDVFPSSFKPAGIITAMGTQVRVNDEPVTDWHTRFADWPREQIAECVTSLGYPAHDPAFQTGHKASFTVPRGEAQQRVARILEAHHLPCRIIASGADDLDILPPGAGKDHASRFITQHLGYEIGQLIVAGDSANDLAMFMIAPCAIAVGNARDELLKTMDPRHAYHAKASHAAGVHEGLIHYQALPNAD